MGPYQTVDRLPDNVRSTLERRGQEKWLSEYNKSFLETKSDEIAAADAWKAVDAAGLMPPLKMSENRMAKYDCQPYPGSRETLIPSRAISKVAGLILHAKAYGGTRSYSENLQRVMKRDEHLSDLYVAGPERGIKYWLVGPNAAEMLQKILAGEED